MNGTPSALWTPLVDHLWQSTLFTAAVWLTTLLLRKNHARVRYGLWLTASVKMLLPFALLVSAGSLLPRRTTPLSQTQTQLYADFYVSGDAMSQPFVNRQPVPGQGRNLHQGTSSYPTMLLLIWLTGAAIVAFRWFLRARQVARIRERAVEASSGREVTMLLRLSPAEAIRVLLTDERIEPGIVGMLRPVLLWPIELSDKLNDGHMEAILRHEMLHASRRDNLAMALHMLVETLFWFHPMVWWMERRLIEEREQACDEAVLEAGTEAEVYADGILRACRFCLESPLPCVAGISGAELNRRIRAIVSFRPANLSFAAKILLPASALLAIALPVMYGLVRVTPFYGQILQAQGPLPSFEVATIKPWSPPAPPPPGLVMVAPIGPPRKVTNPVHFIGQASILIMSAYGLPISAQKDRIVGGPDWMRSQSDRYEINAKIDDSTFAVMQAMSSGDQQHQVALMQQALLQSRFGMKAHIERRELPVYALVLAKDGAKLSEAEPNDTKKLFLSPDAQGAVLTAKAVSLQEFSQAPFLGPIDRLVVDQTGLHGKYNFVLKWNSRTGQSASDGSGELVNEYPDIFTALREQLGLRLVPTKGPVEVLVIDHIERPTAN